MNARKGIKTKEVFMNKNKIKLAVLLFLAGIVFLCVLLVSVIGVAKLAKQAEYSQCNKQFEDDMTRLLSQFFREGNIASVTSQIVLPAQISRLEDIRTETWNIPEKSCQPKMHALLMDYMDKTINTYIKFSADDFTWYSDYSDSLRALAALDDEVCKVYNLKGLVGLFRSKGYYYWEGLDNPSWRNGFGG
jgi:hypothetical protein